VAAKPGGASSGSKVLPELPKAPESVALTNRGADNVATYSKLKKQLKQENLTNIAKHDPRLEAIVKGGSTKNPNFSIGSGTSAEADRLGKLWVGEEARPMSGVQGALVSADGARTYRPPISKDSPFATTGLQANFQQFENGKMISNGHLNITK
jgi:filamentous hemagglutinin